MPNPNSLACVVVITWVITMMFLVSCEPETETVTVDSGECGTYRMDGFWEGKLTETVNGETTFEHEGAVLSIKSTGCAAEFRGNALLATDDALVMNQKYSRKLLSAQDGSKINAEYEVQGQCTVSDGCYITRVITTYVDGEQVDQRSKGIRFDNLTEGNEW